MSIYVFTGPTLPAAEARCELDAVFLPPVSQGDVYRVSLRNPEAIGIIDGIFRHVPSVWHKEILWALHQNIPVFGSASMGALRASELCTFGVQGVGKIFEAYRDGVLEDDDEVAVAHCDANEGFRPLSEAMVNIRTTLQAAEDAGVLSHGSHMTLTRLMKQVFFAARTYPLLIQLGQDAGLPAGELENLASWLPRSRRDQKREDAVAMLHAMRRGIPSSPTGFKFEHTRFFERARRSAGDQLIAAATEEAGRITLEDLLNELRLDPRTYRELRAAAVVRGLFLREARRCSLQITADDLQATADDFRRSRGLHEPDNTERWLAENQMNRAQFRSLMREELTLKRLVDLLSEECQVYIRSELRLRGTFEDLATRIYKKRRCLESVGLLDPAVSVGEPCEDDLLKWYFSERLQTNQPQDVAAYARELDFEDLSVFLASLRRQFWYEKLATAGGASGPRTVSQPVRSQGDPPPEIVRAVRDLNNSQ